MAVAKRLRVLIPLIIVAVIFFFLYRGLQVNPHRIPSPFIGKQVPAFEASNLLHPNQTITNAALKGHVSVLNVFATWCLSCRAEHPSLMDLHDAHIVNIYGVDYKDKRPKALAWLKKYGDPYTKVIFDPIGKVGLNLGVYGTPETFIIDRHGVIRYKYIGAISPTELRETIIPEIKKLERGNG